MLPTSPSRIKLSRRYAIFFVTDYYRGWLAAKIYWAQADRKRISGLDFGIATATEQASAPLFFGAVAELAVAGAGWPEAGGGQ